MGERSWKFPGASSTEYAKTFREQTDPLCFTCILLIALFRKCEWLTLEKINKCIAYFLTANLFVYLFYFRCLKSHQPLVRVISDLKLNLEIYYNGFKDFSLRSLSVSYRLASLSVRSTSLLAKRDVIARSTWKSQ